MRIVFFGTFAILGAFALLLKEHRRDFLARSPGDWVIDLSGTASYAFVLPIVQFQVIYAALAARFPEWRGSLDVLVTARNSLLSPLFMVYIWLNALGGAINTWCHTSFYPGPETKAYRLLSQILVTPNDHLSHHSAERSDCNIGTILSLWDRLLGTWHSPTSRPERLGVPSSLSLWRQLLFPIVGAPFEA